MSPRSVCRLPSDTRDCATAMSLACASSSLAVVESLNSPRSARSGQDNAAAEIDTRVLLYYFLALLRERRLAGPSAPAVQGTIAALHFFLKTSLPLYDQKCSLSDADLPSAHGEPSSLVSALACCVR